MKLLRIRVAFFARPIVFIAMLYFFYLPAVFWFVGLGEPIFGTVGDIDGNVLKMAFTIVGLIFCYAVIIVLFWKIAGKIGNLIKGHSSESGGH